MSSRSIRRVLLTIAAGYSRSLTRITWSLVLIAGAVAVSAAIVFPLWYFSTHNRRGYTLMVLVVGCAAVLFMLFRKTRAFWELAPRERLAKIRRAATRVLIVIAYLVALYIVVGFWLVGMLAAAIPLSLAYLLVLGYSLYARDSRGRK